MIRGEPCQGEVSLGIHPGSLTPLQAGGFSGLEVLSADSPFPCSHICLISATCTSANTNQKGSGGGGYLPPVQNFTSAMRHPRDP